MRKIYSIALTLALLLVSVGIKAQSITTYLNEDFNNMSSGAFPSGWDNTDYTQGTSSYSSSSYLWQVYSGGYNSTNCAHLYCHYYYVSSARLKSPSMTLRAMKDAMVSFKLKNSSETVGDFSLYVTTDDGVTKTPLVQHVLTGTTWTEYSYPLSAYKGQTIKLIFEGAASTTSAYYFLDDVLVKDAPTCQSPADLYINGLTGSGATLNWGLDTRYGYAPDLFSICLKDANGNTVYYNGNVAGTNTSLQFTGLTANSTYTAWIGSNCTPSYHGSSDSISVQFTTLPQALSVPYFENFDTRTDVTSDGFYNQSAQISAQNCVTGTTGKSVQLTTTSQNGAYIVFPLLNIAANNMEVDYYIMGSTTSTMSYFVGYLTDPSDIEGSFTAVAQDSIKSTAWTNKRFNTSMLYGSPNTDTTNPVMFCIQVSSGVAASVYVDNVDVHVIPTCTRPEGLNITNYGADNVTLDWSMANANNVRVYAMNTADSSVITALATTHPYTMTGLTPQTNYQFRVRGICTSADSSEVSTPVTIKTRCATASTPLFFEGAESTTGVALPDCWETGHIHKATTVTSDPFYTGTSTHKSGSRGFVLRDMTSGNIAYLASQKMDFGQTAGTYSFRYWYYRPSGTSYVGEGLKVFVTPTIGDTTNAVQVIQFVNRYAGNSPTGSTGWNQYEGIINYTGEGYIMIVGYSKYGSSSYFDDLEVFTTPTCPKPSGLAAGNATQTTAELSWEAGYQETQWLVSYTVNQGTTTVASVTDTMISGQPKVSLTGLQSATTYTVANMSVRAYCGVGDTSEVVTLSGVNFTTQCGALSTFPYTMGFEDGETYVVYSPYRHPMCWTSYNSLTSTTSSYHYYPYTSSSYYRTGSKSLYNYSSSSSTSYADTAMFALPEIDTTVQAVNGLRMKLWSRSSSSSYSWTLYLGVMTNPNDPSTFVKVDSVLVSGTSFVESTLSLANYTGNGTYVALGWFRSALGSTYAGMYLDDLTLEPIPSCIDLAGGLTVSAVTDTTATLAMSDQTATNWQYAYGLTGTAVTSMTPVNHTGSTLTLTGLTEATTYDIYVRRDCGNSDYSPWAAVTTFSTTAVPATMPYVCGFEDAQENARWQYADGTGVNVFTVGDNSNAIYAGTKAMYVTTDRTATSPAYTYSTSSSSKGYAYRTIHFDAKGYQVEMKAKCTGGETTWDFGRVFLTNVTENLPTGTGTSYGSTTFPNMIAEFDQDFVYSNYKMLNSYSTASSRDANGWVTISYFLDMTNRPGDYNLVLMWNDDSSGGTSSYPLAVDNINIYELTCIPPSAILTDSVSSTAFKLNLQHQTATQFEIIVDDQSFTKETLPDSAVYRQIVNANTAWITGLTSNTQYYYAVRSICGANDTSDWSDVSSLNTFCAMVNLPVSEGFESTTSTNCWLNMSAATVTGSSISRYTGYKHSGSASMKIVKADAVSPELNVTTLESDMLNGWVYSTADSVQFTVSVMTDPNDITSMSDPLGTVTILNKNTWTEFTTYFTLLSDDDFSEWYNARYIVISVGGENTIYFDDLIIDVTPTCPKPTEVSITNVTANSFDISFTNNAPGCTSWEVRTNGTPHVITTNPTTISGLTAHTSYSVEIAAICSASDTSYYTNCGTIQTECDALPTPYTCGFETSEGFSYSSSYVDGVLEEQCWQALGMKPSGATYPYYRITNETSYSHSSSQALKGFSASGSYAYWILPSFGDPTDSLFMELWYRNEGTTTASPYVEIGYMTDPAVDTTFVMLQQLSRTTTMTKAEQSFLGQNVPSNARLAVRFGGSSSNNYYCSIDDILVKRIRSCSDPNAPAVSNITASSANVVVSDTCATHNSWQYVYGQTGFDPDQATPQTVDSTMRFTLTGLNDETSYTVYVRAFCGGSDYSNWMPTTFKTLCSPFHVTSANSFSEDFSNFNYGAYINTEGVCYSVLNEPVSTSYWAKIYPSSEPSATSSYKYCYGRTADNMDKCLYWYQYSYTTSMPNGGTILRQFHLDADSVYELSGWGRSYQYSGSYKTTMSAVMGTTTNNLDTLASKTISANSVASVYDGTYYWYYYNTLYEQLKTVISVDSTGDYYIGFNLKNGTTATNYAYCYFDDWTMRAYAGCAPKQPAVSEITDSSAHVTMSAPAYQFEYVLNDTTAAKTIVDTTEFDLTGLNSASAYTLYVRSYCDATSYSEWMEVQFTTACGVIRNFPYTQDFESYATGSAPVCWSTSASTTSTTGANLWGVYAYSGNQMLHMWNYMVSSGNAIVETPTFALPAQPVEVAFDYTNTVEANDFLFKISTNGGASYTTLGTYPTSSSASSYEYGDDPGTFTHVVLDLTNYVGQNVKFQLFNQATYGYGAVFFDNMTISYIPACREPQSAPTVTGTTMTTLSAQANMATKDTIEFGIAPYAAGVVSDSITTTVLSTDGNCTFTGLTGSTTYAVWYRYHCDSAQVSDWSRAYARGTTMSTDCFDPQNLRTVGVVNDHHAAITWGTAPNATRYDYELYQAASATGTPVNTGSTTLKPDTIVFDSLSGNSAYYFRVRGFCSGGDTTAWIGLSIQTTYPTMTIPFVCNFENPVINNAWNYSNNVGSNQFVIGNDPNAQNGGNSSLYVSDDGSNYQYTKTSQSVSGAEVLLELPAGNYLVSYDWYCYGESSWDYGRFFLAPSNYTLTGSTYSVYKSLPTGAISLDNNAILNSVTSWQNYSKIITIATDGVYKLMATWCDDTSAGTDPPLAIDNINIQEVACMPLADVDQTALTSHSTKFALTRYTAGLDVQYGYSTIDNVDSITWTTIQNTGLTDTVSITGLAANTQYYFFAREICDSAHISPATRVSFKTPSDGQTLPFICSFEASETTTAAWQFAGSNNQFVIGSGFSSQGTNGMYISDDGSSWNYSISTTSNSYAYVPLSFGAGTYDIEYDWQAYGESTYDYARVYLAPSSFVPTAGSMASGIGYSSTPTGWIAIDGGTKLNLVNATQSVAVEHTFTDSTIMNLIVFWHNDASVGTQYPFGIDNIRISKQLCTSLLFDSISVDTIGYDMFTLHYVNPTPGAATEWTVYSDYTYSDTIAHGIVPDSLDYLTATGLSASTKYYCTIRSVCGVDTVSKVTKFQIRTKCDTISQYPYDEGFENMYPVNVYYLGSSNQFTDACWTTTSFVQGSYYGCPVDQSAAVHSGDQGMVVYNGYSSSTSQLYALPAMDSLNGKYLSLYYYTSSSSYYTCISPELGYINAAGTFVNIQTLQEVAGWTEYSTTISGLPATAKRLALQFEGALYAYVDDIHINNVVPGSTYADTICHGAAYTGHGFTFAAGQLRDGDTTFTRTINATVPGAADSITTLNIHVRPEIMTTTYDTICSGQPYNRGMWQIANPQSTMYYASFTSTLTGCDSTCYLYLYVYPTFETINDTICEGDSYQFGGQTITATGTYNATITNKWGCTVTTTLNLLVVDSTSVTNATICQGDSYQFEGHTYTQSGTYHVQVVGAGGCPVHKTLNLTVNKSDSTVTISFCKGGSVLFIDTVISTPGNYTVTRFNATAGCSTVYHITATEDPIKTGTANDYACQDHLYYGFGLNGVTLTKDTTVQQTIRDYTGLCDSMVVATIKYVATVKGITEEKTITAGESYIWHDQSYDKSGYYYDTVASANTGCDSICTLKLTVGDVPPTGVDNVQMLNISLVPNPVNAGQTSFVYGNFTNVKSVEVLNSFGQVIDTFVPESYPIEVKSISASGIYYVRVVTDDDKIAVQKLIVK